LKSLGEYKFFSVLLEVGDRMATAYVCISTEPGQEDDVLKEVKKLKFVKEAYQVFGNCDILAKVYAKRNDIMDKRISGIRKLDGIESTVTHKVV
jgi:DNA-binding Lrp family transcriptional regulator